MLNVRKRFWCSSLKKRAEEEHYKGREAAEAISQKGKFWAVGDASLTRRDHSAKVKD